MRCLHPIFIRNPNYDNDPLNEPLQIPVPCGRCELCLHTVAQEWCRRLEIEWKCSESSVFVTLTYSDDKIPLFRPELRLYADAPSISPMVSKRDVQLFFKRLRKSYPESNIRYFLCAEYGPGTYRPHYHCIIFNLPMVSCTDLKSLIDVTKGIQRCWDNGAVTVDPVTFGRVSYCTMYVCSVADLPPWLPPTFRLMSRRPGIGSGYLENMRLVDWHRVNLANYLPDGERKRRLPRFLKDKIFDSDMMAQIKEQNVFQSNLIEQFGFHFNDSTYYEHMDTTFGAVARFKRKFYDKYVKKRKNI